MCTVQYLLLLSNNFVTLSLLDNLDVATNVQRVTRDKKYATNAIELSAYTYKLVKVQILSTIVYTVARVTRVH